MRHVVPVVLCGLALLVEAGAYGAQAWYVRTVVTEGDVGQFSSLALDANGYPHIAYYDATNQQPKHVAWNGTAWSHFPTVDIAPGVGKYISLALDSTDYPHVSYYDAGNLDLRYAAWNGSTWYIQAVDSAGRVGGYTSLALDASGYPHISYYDYANGDLKCAGWTGLFWDIQTVDTEARVRTDSSTSLVLDTSGYPHISYFDGTNYDLKCAAWNGSSWDIETVDSAGYVGWYTSLALDASGYAHISYCEAGNDDLRYAAWNGTGWDIETVDSAGNVGSYTSLALDASGYPHISYYDDTNGDLKYAASNGSSWDIQTVDWAGDVGAYTSLAVAADGYVHISYYDDTNGDLKYATTRLPPEASHELSGAGYYMISFPLAPTSTTVHDLLCDDLGDGNYYMWAWGGLTGPGYLTIPTGPPGCETTLLSMQRGYWLLAGAATLDMDVGGVLPHGDQRIPLQTGWSWNMVAAPYEATMDSLQVDNAGDVRSLAEAQAANWVLATFYYSHDGSGGYQTATISQTPPDTLSLWYGYWVLAGVDCSLIVPEPSGGAGGTVMQAAQRAPVQPAWAFDIQASSGSSVDGITLAAADSASDDFDGFALDKPKPPRAPGEGSLRMVLRGKGGRGRASPPYNKAAGGQMPWASELAMETKGATQESVEWDFAVTGGIKGEPVRLSWPELNGLPKDRVAILTDRDTGKRSFMRSCARYEFAAPDQGASRSFTVTVKAAQEGAVVINGLSAVPTRGGGAWDIGFSLSADAAVTARVYNVAGRPVASIAEGSQLGRGPASLTWNARGLTGTHVPSGTYLLRITARTEAGEQASAVTSAQVAR